MSCQPSCLPVMTHSFLKQVLAEHLLQVRPCPAAAAAAAKSLQSCRTLCDPIDGSPPGSSVPGILQARILEWVAKNTGVGCHFSLESLSGAAFSRGGRIIEIPRQVDQAGVDLKLD